MKSQPIEPNNIPRSAEHSRKLAQAVRWANAVMALCLGVMSVLVFVNAVLRHGFGKSIASSEELARLLFVWMVFIGATVAYPLGEHMAFNGLAMRFKGLSLRLLTGFIHLTMVVACALVGWGAWQQVAIGWQSVSVVLKYPVALLPLPALLASAVIGMFALKDLLTFKPIAFDVHSEVE
jgi:TRAP-type transport system small permease protein